jgi:uncharacterized protein with HEPN domain
MSFTKNKKYYDFEKDKQIRYAVERCFEVLGIASTKLSLDARETLKKVPWRSIIGLRNLIAHEYGEIKIEKIWYFSQTHIPELVKELSAIDDLMKIINNMENK